MIKHILLPCVLATLLLGACDRSDPNPAANATPIPEPVAKTDTLETRRLASAIDSYEATPSTESAASVKQAMAALDGEIAELESRVAKTSGGERDEASVKLQNLQTYRDTQAARFTLMRAKETATPTATPVDGRSGADKTEARAREVGGQIQDGARRAGDALEDAGRNVKDAIDGARQ